MAVAGSELHCERRGQGAPLLLIQGMGANGTHWGEPFLAELERGFELILPDHRGIGRSAPLQGATITVPALASCATARQRLGDTAYIPPLPNAKHRAAQDARVRVRTHQDAQDASGERDSRSDAARAHHANPTGARLLIAARMHSLLTATLDEISRRAAADTSTGS